MESEVAATTTEQITEHVVLLNIPQEEGDSEEDPSSGKVNQMLNSLNAVNSLDEIIYLTAGPILRIRSSSPSSSSSSSLDMDADADVSFSHVVHARFRSQSELAAYSAMELQLVRAIFDDFVVVDWVADGLGGPLVPKPGAAVRLTLFELKQQQREGKGEGEGQGEAEMMKDEVIMLIMEELRTIKDKLSDYPVRFEQMSFGQNVSISNTNSYKVAVGALVVFRDLNALDACEEYEEEMRSLIHSHYQNQKVIQSSLRALIHLDYVLPRLTLAPPPPPPH